MADKSVKDLSTIGLKVGIAFEAVAGTMPVASYYHVPRVSELPDMDFDPDTIETTTFDNTDYKSYIDGLKDTGGILSLTANYTEYGVFLWDSHAELEKTDATKGCWLVISIEGIDTKYFIPINVIPTGIPSAPLNDKVSIGYKFTVTGDIVKQSVTSSTLFATGQYTA